MPISRRVLADDEDVLVDLHPHWVFFLGPAVLVAVAVAVAVGVAARFPHAPVAVAWVLAAMVGVPALWLAGRLVRWWSISLVVTTDRLLYRQGILGRDLVQIRLQRVTEVHCTQSLFERLIGAGRLVLELQGDDPVVVDDVRRPQVLQRVVAAQLDELTGPPATSAAAPPGAPASSGATAPLHAPPGTWADLPGDRSRPAADPQGERTPPQGVPVVAGMARPADPTWPFPPDRDPAASSPLAPVAPAPGTTPPGPGAGLAERLVALDGLRQRGLITDAEFNRKKAQLLDRL